MATPAWLEFLGPVPTALRAQVMALFKMAAIDVLATRREAGGLGIAVLAQADDGVLDALRELVRDSSVLAIAVGAGQWDPAAMWRVLDAGAADLLLWPALPATADDVACRLQRWQTIRTLVDSDIVRKRVAGRGAAWQSLLRGVVEVARLTQSSVLITGETGTGKEQIAHLIHELDGRDEVGEFVVVDCTTLSSELSGSEFFGHERGAFTGAAGARDGAFALAHGGTLFLDEVGELSIALQAQLLRVVQERQYKRLGSNTWQRSDFRLICATHRDLDAAVANGSFRADLFYRIAAWRCTAPPLRERMEDILPLARFILAQLEPRAAPLEMDPAVKEYLLTREYPGNVRDLCQTVARLWQRHSGHGPLTVGDVPEDERPAAVVWRPHWPDRNFDAAVRHAVELNIGLKEIGQTATELATQAALDQEGGNLQRAAARLGVTDRALQIRRANQRATH
ncbi:MAG: RNA polymerase subunit sigma-54 [Candidatus Accumulibacter phosphatis]|uniref:RNA polymerase subunit sigma-54 n=1 Tax=Candidatus Accumulibacter phosphatis TaxID=327160 RepID=A0A6A7RS99_9PROT|nr:RNA polymerase subunit sigma-54 [Candidatus Accumulibacter phosphatis]